MPKYFLVAILSVLAAVVAPLNVRAEVTDQEQGTTQIRVSSSGPVVRQGTAGFDAEGTRAGAAAHGQEAPPTGATPGPGVTFVPVHNNLIVITGAPWVDRSGTIHEGPGLPAGACPPGQMGFFVIDPNGVNQGVVCVPAQGAVAPASPAVQLAEQASAAQPWPNLVVGISPVIGLTGLPSWFWMGGSATMPDATASANGIAVTVRATLMDVVWNFGDGATFDAGADLGSAFPVASRIQHVYQTDTLGLTGGYDVSVVLRFRVTYSVNGSPFLDLGTKARPYRSSYVVNQLQPQAVKSW